MLNKRGCGILLHPTSLPGPGGIGSLGADARRFIDELYAMGMSYWQILPLTPPSCGNSPYSACSAFGGNPLLIDCLQLSREGDLPSPAGDTGHYPEHRVDFSRVIAAKMKLLHQAGSSFLKRNRSLLFAEFRHYCDSTPWLDDCALFMALKERFNGVAWNHWPRDCSCPDTGMRNALSAEFQHEIELQKYLQWQFSRQWRQLRSYAHDRGVALIGDIPIFVAYDSADVWSQRALFLLGAEGKPTFVAGVPPDYFSATGQLWGNPLYDWERMAQDGYGWWIDRFKTTFELFDIVRIDHFRGFEAAWHIPTDALTAEQGEWIKGPGEQLFDALGNALGELPIIAEDLGVITPEVIELRDRYCFPGMKILQFAFEKEPVNLPHLHVHNGVVYSGTHDNDTTAGWYASITAAERRNMCDYLGCQEADGVDALIRAALMSVANTAVIPLQDILKLGSEARMNVPGTPFGNWEWRFTWEMLPQELSASVRTRIERYERTAPGGLTHAA